MDDKFQTEPNALEPEFKEENQIPTIAVPQGLPESEQPEDEAEPAGNIQVPGVVLADEPEVATPGWTAQDDQDSVQAFKELMSYRKKRDELGRVADSIGNIIGYQEFKGKEIPIVGQDMGNDVAQYRRDYFPTEEERQKGYLEAVGLGQINRGVGQSFQLLGDALTQAGVLSTGEYLKQQGQFWQGNAPKRDIEAFTDIKGFKDGLNWYFEEAQVMIGQNVLTMGAAGLGTLAGGPFAGMAALGTINLGMGVGEARSLASQNYNEWENLAEKAEDEGRQVEARAFRQLASQFDPDKPENLPIITAAGSAIALLETMEDKMVWFKPIPEHLKAAIKQRLYKVAVRHIALAALDAGVKSGATETIQAVVSTLQEIKMRGAKEWIDYFDWNEQQRLNILNSAAAGFAGGSAISGVSNALTAANAARKGAGAAEEDAKESGAPMFEGVPQVAEPTVKPEEVAPREPVTLDDDIRTKLETYLSDPKAVLSNKDRVSEALGVPKERVGDYLDAAAEEGLLTKIERKGLPNRYVRKQRVEMVIPETGEAAGAEFILPEPADAPTQTTVQEPAQPEMVSAPTGEVQAPVVETTEGASSVSVEIDPAKQISGIEAQIADKRQQLEDVRAGLKGASPAEREQITTASSVLREQIKALRKELKALEDAPAKVVQPQEEAAKPAPQQELKAEPQAEFKPEERQQAEAAKKQEAAQYLPDMTEGEAKRINELALDKGLSVDDSLETLFKEYAESLVNVQPDNATAPSQQSSVPQERAGEGARPAGEGNAPEVRAGNAQPSQEGLGGGLLTRKDVIPFAVFRNERAKSAVKFAEKIEERLRQAFGLTETDKAKRLISKVKPITKDGKAVQFKMFDRSLKGLSDLEQGFIREAEGGSSGTPIYGFYNYDTSTIALSLYAGQVTGDSIRPYVTHEVLHALVDIGVLDTVDISRLAEEATKRYPKAVREVERLYGRLYNRMLKERRDLLIEEEKAALLVQMAFDKKIRAEESLIKDIIERIKEILDNIVRAFRGEGDQEQLTWLDVIQSLVDTKVGSGQAGRYVTNDDLAQAIEKIRADLRKEDMSKPNTYLAAIKAYHGSPHDFEYFDLSKIGTGEGAQAYGYGLYFTETEKIASGYRDALSRRNAPFSAIDEKYMREAVQWLRGGRDGEVSSGAIVQINDAVSDFAYDYVNGPRTNVPDSEIADYIEAAYKQRGALYEVTIDANPEDFLDWDKPLSQQSEKVRNALSDQRIWDAGNVTDLGNGKFRVDKPGLQPELFNNLAEAQASASPTGEVIIRQILEKRQGRKGAADVLRQKGIFGIRYLDGNSRGAGQGSYNYVVFDEKLITITAKNGDPVNRKPILAALKITKDDAPQGKSVMDIVNEVAGEMAAKPVPVIGTKKTTLSIPGLKKPMSPAEAAEALRAEREGQTKLLGPFAPRPELSDWLGIPLVGFQADIQHIYNKRTAKDAGLNERLGRERMKPIASLEEVRSIIETVLDNAQFAHKYKTDGWTLVYQDGKYDYVVGLYPKVSGRPGFGAQLRIATAYVAEKGERTNAVIASIEDGGLENVAWKKSVSAIDRLLLNVRQARGPGKHPSIDQTIRELQKEQLALKGVKPPILAALSGNQNNQGPVKGINTIIRELVDDLGITLNQGFGGPWGYKTRAGVIRQKAYYDLDTLSRNLGDLMGSRFDWVAPLIMNHTTELAPLDTIDMDAAQGFREWVNLYVSAPDKALKAAPDFFEAFEAELEANAPDYLRAIGTAQMALEAYFDADPTAAVESMITNAPHQTSMAKIKREIERDGVFNTLKHGVLMAYKDTVASEAPLSSIVRQMLRMRAEKTGMKKMLPVVQNAAKLYRLIPQAQQAASFDVERGIMDIKTGQVASPGLPEILRDALGDDVATAMNLEPGGIYSQFLGYLVALRAAQLWRAYEAKAIPRPPTVVPEDTVLKAIAQYEAANPKFKAAQAKLNTFTRALLKLKRDAGLITEDQYNKLKDDRFYVPFQRSFDEEIKVAFEGGSGVNVENILKRLKGSRRDVIDPIGMLAKDVYTTRQLIAVNDVWKALIAQAEEAGPNAGEFVERVNPKKISAELVAVEDVIKNAAKEAGLSNTDAQSLMDTVTAELGSDALATVFKQQTANTKGKPIALFIENGKLQALSVNDPALAKLIFDSFQFLGKEHTGMLLNALSIPTKLVRMTITTSPKFIVANAIRDAVFAPFHEFRMIPFWAQAKGLSKIVRGDPILEEAMRSGMIMGGVGASVLDQNRLDQNIKQLVARGYKVESYGSIADFVKDMKVKGATLGADGLKGSFSRFQTFMEFSETASRIQLYEIAKKRAIRNGLTEIEARREAALYANDYCDYSRNGSKIGPFRKMVEFFNAILQGLDRFRRTVAGSHDMESVWRAYYKYKTGKGPALTQDEIRQLHQSTFAVMYSGLVIGGISQLIWMLYHDDERLRDVPADIRRTHWVIPLGDVIHLVRKVHPGIAAWMSEKGGDRDLLRIPKPFDAAFLSNLIERYLWEAKKGDPNWVAKFLEDFTDTSLPPMFPTWMNIYSLSQGIDPQSGRPIETRQMQQQLAPPDRYTPFTSDFAKWWGEKTNSSPVVVDAMIKGLGTSWARDMLNLNIPGSPWYNPNKPAKGLDEAFMVSRFLWQVGKMSETGRAFREAMGEENPLNTIMRKTMTLMNVYHPANKLGFAAGSYSHRFENAPLDHANKFLIESSPRERGYAILMKGLSGRDAKLEKLDPMNRASDIGLTAFQLQKEIQSGTLKENKGKKTEKKTELNANSRLSARDILIQLQWMEQHNAMTLTKEIGYENREIYDVNPLYDELKAVDPVIHAEFMKRLERKNVLPFAGVRAIWPELQRRLESEELLKEAQQGKPEAVEPLIRDLWFKAKYPATKMMKLGGPKLPDTTLYEDGSRRPEFEKWPDNDRMDLNEDENEAAAMATDESYGKKMMVKPKPQLREQGL